MASTEVVYGDPDDRVVFLLRSDAERLSAMFEAVGAETWGEFRKRIALVEPDRAEYDPNEEPADNEPFDEDAVPGYPDGDWPPMPEAIMADWLVSAIGDVGEVATTIFNGDFLRSEPTEILAVVARLESAGFDVTRDDDLIQGLPYVRSVRACDV